MVDMAQVNALLAAEDDRLTAARTAPERPVTFIVAPPRAASSLFQQVVASVHDVGYVTNTLARFWRAPAIGAVLDKGLRDPLWVSNLRSRYGNTEGPQEPHEWGFFWHHWLRLEGDSFYADPAARPLDGPGLNAKLAALEATYDAPLMFDNVYAMANLDALIPLLPLVLAVHLTRDPYFVCNSMLNARISRYGDINTFYAHPPRTMAALQRIADPVEQVVRQIKDILDEMDAALALLPADAVFKVDYLDMVADPLAVADAFAAFLDRHGAPVRPRTPRPDLRLAHRNTPAQVAPDLRDRLDAAFARVFGTP